MTEPQEHQSAYGKGEMTQVEVWRHAEHRHELLQNFWSWMEDAPDADLSPFLMDFVDLATEEDDRIDWEESYEHGWIIRPKRVDPSQVKQADPDEVPVYVGDGVIEYLEERYKLDGQFGVVVETLVKLGPLTLPQLIDKSKVSNPSHVLATGLRKHKFLKPFFRMPGVKCNLGYSTTIRALADK